MNKSEELTLLQLSILAVRADGNISDSERTRLNTIIADFNPTQEQYSEIDKCWVGEMSLQDVAEKTLELNIAEDAFKRAVNVLLIDGLNQREHEFLRELAEYLEFDDKKCQKLFMDVSEEIDFELLGQDEEFVKDVDKIDLDKLVLNYSLSAGSIGLTPIPFVSDFILLTPLQMKMVYDIGKRYGYDLDKKSLKEFSTLLGVAFGLKMFGSILKLIPIIGSLGGAAVAFSGTYAMGKTAEKYFKEGRKVDEKQLKAMYGKFKVEGEKLYKTVKDRIKAMKSEK
ncbi:MAG: DUF533 domain-containing protein [Nitrospinae bacterium]|nr:DUF533 domain-containing protein [Nitrospinota bacterium]